MAKLSSLFGQEPAIGVLRRALEGGRLPGAYLFVGTAGVGKLSLGQAFAQAATCLNPVETPFDSCGVCDSCRRAENGTHPEIVTVRPAGEQMQIWQFWDRDGKPPGVLSRTMHYGPSIGKRRIFLIEKAETLNESAANSLLKVLEEPPPYVVFVLLAPSSSRVLPTIVSRSQMVRVRALPVEELADYAAQKTGIDRERALLLSAYAEGRIGQAMTFALNPVVKEEIDRVLDFAEGIPNAPMVRALRIAEGLRKIAAATKALAGEETSESESEGGVKEKAARKQYAAVFDLLVTFYRDLLALRAGNDRGAVNRERLPTFKRLAMSSSLERWMRCLDALLLARRRLDANVNVTLMTEVLAMTLLEA